MKELDLLHVQLTNYFNMGKLSAIPQKERSRILKNLRLKIFEYLERSLTV